MSKRARLAGFTTAGMAVALLGGGEPAAARPRSLSFAQAEQAEQIEQAVEPLSPAQRDQLVPTQRPGSVSLAQATSMAQSRYEGRVVSARSVQMGDRLVHEIRILGDDNRVHIVRIDAQTGSFL
jgi:uncharacterized membrane protein YkoI